MCINLHRLTYCLFALLIPTWCIASIHLTEQSLHTHFHSVLFFHPHAHYTQTLQAPLTAPPTPLHSTLSAHTLDTDRATHCAYPPHPFNSHLCPLHTPIHAPFSAHIAPLVSCTHHPIHITPIHPVHTSHHLQVPPRLHQPNPQATPEQESTARGLALYRQIPREGGVSRCSVQVLSL